MTLDQAVDHALGWAMAADNRNVMWGKDVRLPHRTLLARFVTGRRLGCGDTDRGQSSERIERVGGFRALLPGSRLRTTPVAYSLAPPRRGWHRPGRDRRRTR